jgi:hypothetical protein
MFDADHHGKLCRGRTASCHDIGRAKLVSKLLREGAHPCCQVVEVLLRSTPRIATDHDREVHTLIMRSRGCEHHVNTDVDAVTRVRLASRATEGAASSSPPSTSLQSAPAAPRIEDRSYSSSMILSASTTLSWLAAPTSTRRSGTRMQFREEKKARTAILLPAQEAQRLPSDSVLSDRS